MGNVRGERVLIERRTLNMNQDALAAQVGVDRTYISKIERNEDVNVGVKTVFGLAEALGVTVQYLLGLSDYPLPENSSPSLLAESSVIYEVGSPIDRRQVQALLDDFLALDPALREVVLNLAATLRTTSTPRIIGRE